MSDDPTQEQAASQLIACENCGDKHPLADMTHEETKRTDLIEVYMECPSCKQRLHVYFDSPDLRQKREAVRAALAEFKQAKTQAAWAKYQHARQVYNRQFDKLNRHWRRKLGMYKQAEAQGAK